MAAPLEQTNSQDKHHSRRQTRVTQLAFLQSTRIALRKPWQEIYIADNGHSLYFIYFVNVM